MTLCVLFSLDGKTTYKINYNKCSATACSLKITPKVADTIRLSLPQKLGSDWKFKNVTGLSSPYYPSSTKKSIYEEPIFYFDVMSESDTASFTAKQYDYKNNKIDEKTFTFNIKSSKK